MNKTVALVAVVLVLVGGYMYYGKNQVTVREFSMTSWMEMKDDVVTSAYFSLGEMKVKKGDTVRITVTNTAGIHDFVIDEFDVQKETPLNEPVVIEFVADKAGTFEYYCSKYNHRQIGQRGNLIVE